MPDKNETLEGKHSPHSVHYTTSILTVRQRNVKDNCTKKPGILSKIMQLKQRNAPIREKAIDKNEKCTIIKRDNPLARSKLYELIIDS